MHEITGDRDEVLKLLDDTIRALEHDAPEMKKAAARGLGVKSAKASTAQCELLVVALRSAYVRQQAKKPARATGLRAPARATPVQGEAAVSSPYRPRDRAVALIQSAMDEYLDATV